MEEIKINDYIRTKYGEIEKVESIDKYEENYYLTDVNGYKEERDIVKHSPNITKVLETGDIIEHKIYQEIFKSEIYITNNDEIFTTDGERILPEEIISVVTHELFNQVKYEV